MLIAIEGIDGSGKATQTDLLRKRLLALGKTVGTLSFPVYGEWPAVFVERFLLGQLGPADSVDPYVAASFYALDRFGHRDRIRATLASYDVVISDRSSVSNFIHRGVPFVEAGDMVGLDKFFAWLSDFEFARAGLPRPDVTVFLSLSMESVRSLLRRKSRENRAYVSGGLDAMEKDLVHQASARRVGLEILPRYFDRYHVVACEDADGKILPPTEVCERIMATINPYLAER